MNYKVDMHVCKIMSQNFSYKHWEVGNNGMNHIHKGKHDRKRNRQKMKEKQTTILQ